MFLNGAFALYSCDPSSPDNNIQQLYLLKWVKWQKEGAGQLGDSLVQNRYC